jgi:hypothetical protein
MRTPFVSICAFLICNIAYAQGYEGKPCTSSAFAKELLIKKELKQIIFIGVCDPDQG